MRLRYQTKLPGVMIIFALCYVFVLCCCAERGMFVKRINPDKVRIIVEELKSSPEKPIMLCGEVDLNMFLRALSCANGDGFYKNIENALENQDHDFSFVTEDGREVMKFDGACLETSYSIYVTMQGCDKVQTFDDYLMDENSYQEYKDPNE